MLIHKSYKKMLTRLERDGWRVSVSQNKHNVITIEKDGITIKRTLAKTPSTQRAIVEGIASFRRELRKRGYTTLDNFTARLMTLYEVEQIINAAAEKLRDDVENNLYAAIEDDIDVLSAVASISDACLEKNSVMERAHNEYLKKRKRLT